MLEKLNSHELIVLIKKFVLDIKNETSGLKTVDYKKEYNGTVLNAHFYKMFGGNSKFVNSPWIVFLAHNQKTTNGIYPSLFYDRKSEINNFQIGYSISEKNKPDRNWNIDFSNLQKNNSKTFFCKLSLTINNDNDIDKYKDQIITNLNSVIADFHNQFKTPNYWMYSAGFKSALWNDFYQKNIMAIGWEYLGDLTQYEKQEEIATKIQVAENRTQYPMNDSKANWEFANEINIGDIVYVKQGLDPILLGRGVVKSDYIFDDSQQEFKSIRKVEWTHKGNFFVDFNELDIKQWNQKTLTNISQNKYGDFCLKIEKIFNNTIVEGGSIMKNIPLNQILYGPPGTGKTFTVRKYIDQILGKNPGLNIENEDQRINNVVKDSNWYSAIALSMYQNGKNNKYKVAELLEQKIIKAFSLTRENKNVRAALWAQMQIHTHENCPNVNYSNRLAPFIFEKNENSEWYLTEDGIKFVEENLSEQLEQLSAKNNTRKLEDFYKFLTFHQSYSYEEFVEGIKPQIRTDEECSSVSYEYNKGVFKEICQQANSDPDNNYLLIIDEINRGNISKIFGELITLIEIDKRIIPNGERIFENTVTKDEQLLVTLPYTKSKFGVPNNLYILGTMNTSDRSIASIDIALRRRFKFVEMMPNSDLVADFECNFKEIFEKLNTKIKILLDRDHQIGHSYFINTKYANADVNILKEIWFSEILPLLNEYFYCDWEKLKLIIPGFIKEIEIPDYLKNECDEIICEFKTSDEVEDFLVALNQEKFE